MERATAGAAGGRSNALLFVFRDEGAWTLALLLPDLSPLMHRHERTFTRLADAYEFACEQARGAEPTVHTQIIMADPREPIPADLSERIMKP